MTARHSPRVVIAPDKFKGSLTAAQAAEAIARGVARGAPSATCVACPMADGGEGTVDAFLARGARRELARVDGPLGAPVEAAFALSGRTAIVEMSSASGLGLLDPSQYDPVRADTFGTGQLLSAALDRGAQRVILGIGGSATNDAGAGMLRALGARFLNAAGRPLGRDMVAYEDLRAIDCGGFDPRLDKIELQVAVDVDNPLCGPNGASRVFGPQKGATAAQAERLDAILAHVADVAAATLGHDERDARGAGAAGGLGFALLAFLYATIRSGVALIAAECGLDKLLDGAGFCLTGEGKIDGQTLHGKTVDGVARLACARGVAVVAFAGLVEPAAAQALRARGVEVVPIAAPGTPPEVSIRHAADDLETAAAAVAARWGDSPGGPQPVR